MNEDSNGSGKAAIIIIILVLVLAGSAGAWYFLMYKPEQEAKEKARLEQLAKEEAAQKAKELAAQHKVKYDQLIAAADSAFEQKNWESARSLYTEALSLFPDEQVPKDQLAIVNARLDEMARSAAGRVERVPSPTGRFYIVVSSSIDDDLAMDYAQRLAKEGNTVKILEHDTGKHLFYRVSTGDFTNLEQAQAALDSFRSYANEVWVLKY